jgi:hypothetical protein
MTTTETENWLGAKHMVNATRDAFTFPEADLVLNSRALAIPTLTTRRQWQADSSPSSRAYSMLLAFPALVTKFQLTVRGGQLITRV